uniref:Uncharacterized protein n=1 Tax=candidate division WOR-3 bacterium TaxID=2052148 RepID=A0A7V3RGK8_UNCW3
MNNQFFYVFGQDMIVDLDPIWMCWRGWLYTHPARWYLGRQPITGFAKKKEKNLQNWFLISHLTLPRIMSVTKIRKCFLKNLWCGWSVDKSHRLWL